MTGARGNKVMGRTKQVAGRAMGNRRLEREGKTQETTGKAQGVVQRAGKKVEDVLGRLRTRLSPKRRERALGRPARSRRSP